jgi:hypothetical protein
MEYLTKTIKPKMGYTGSTYAWEGDKIGSGKMRMDWVTVIAFPLKK